MAIKRVEIKVVPGNMTKTIPHSGIVDLVRRGQPINEGDRGKYLVAVFACADVAPDGKTYDTKKSQWRWCINKEQWKAALAGRDTFTDEQKTLILAGYELLKSYHHGWGIRAIAQAHVQRLLKQWATGIDETDDVSLAESDLNVYEPTKGDLERHIGIEQRRTGEQQVDIDVVFDEIEKNLTEKGLILKHGWRARLESELI